jgi:hypothetical protein
MSVQGPAARKLFDLELPARIAEIARVVEGRARQPIHEVRGGGDHGDVAPVIGFFDDTGRPTISVGEKKGAVALEAVTIEVLRLWLRNSRYEKNMPYSEMRHPANQRLCRRLYRVLEEEILNSEAETAGVTARSWMRERMVHAFVEPLSAGKYRKGEADPGRTREGALDALQASLAEVDTTAARRLGVLVAEHDAAIARAFGLMYRVVEQHRPFDGEERVRGAYYLAVPFLFDARKPSTPIMKTRQV